MPLRCFVKNELKVRHLPSCSVDHKGISINCRIFLESTLKEVLAWDILL